MTPNRLRFLMGYAAFGLILSLALHLLAVAGVQPPGGTILFAALHIGIFPLWIPVVSIAMKTGNNSASTIRWGWLGFLSGCPLWMLFMTLGFMIYAGINFSSFVEAPIAKQVGGDPPTAVWRGFSGHWMLFYSAGLAIVTAAHRRGTSNHGPKCPNGHSIGFGDKFCATCGTPISNQPH
jgi:hypothetical protein